MIMHQNDNNTLTTPKNTLTESPLRTELRRVLDSVEKTTDLFEKINLIHKAHWLCSRLEAIENESSVS